jgi:glucosylglycerate synthase
VIAPDLLAMQADTLHLMFDAIVEKQSDLAMASYPFGKFDGLLNLSILAPVARALYGRRVRYPLSADFSASPRLFAALSELSSAQSVMWPATEAALADAQICQIHVKAAHSTQTGGLDLSGVLSELVGSLFTRMEETAAAWQRIRSSQATPVWGDSLSTASDGEAVDVQPMLDSFQLGSRNLQEIWSLVLPPVTLLELKRLTRLTRDQFRMPDELWVRIIYDFALAYRLRTINRSHLLGALTPLYLGWVASYVLEVGKAATGLAELRIEKLARAFEEGKSYLVSRWRWPDRFNP